MQRVITYLLVAFLAVLSAMAEPEDKMIPDAPILQFRLPGFDEDGDRSWVLAGEQARILSPEEIEVTTMVLRTFLKSDPRNAQTTIESPLALIYPNESLAWGNDIITINDRFGAYSIMGRDWLWRGEENKITINENARVTFREGLGSILE